MTERAATIDAFLERSGWGEARRAPLSGDASFRRYERLTGGPEPALLMDAPPPMEDVRPYVTVARHLCAMGYSAPRVLAADVQAGLLVIEDFGDETYTRRLAEGADEEGLYELAVDVLIDLHRREDARQVSIPPYDDGRLIQEASLLVDWYLPETRGAVPEPVRQDYIDRWRALFPVARAVPDTLVLRDYHVDNLMWLAPRSGVARCGLLDFQDAVIGPVSYDLVSLLEDARRDIEAARVERMRRRYLDAFADLDSDAFAASYAVLGAQRNAKIIGIFTRLWRRDGKPVYLRHIPRVWRLLEDDLRHPALAPIADWFERNVPPADRGAPAAEGAA
ncbi:MAG: phosphotransferase [Alphaproteobacteria bacterium]|nr:phosphotransferase [Alphaproteobacteria bacterium]